MEKQTLLYSGKAKDIYATDDPDLCILRFRDDATALNGLKKGSFEDKGVLNNAMSAILFELLEREGVSTHFVKRLSDREMLAQKVRIIPLEVIVRNVATGSFSQRYGVNEGTELSCMVLEYCYKDDTLGDPQMNETHVLALGLATLEQLNRIAEHAAIVNSVLTAFFAEKGLRLIDFKLEFGVTSDGTLVLADELSPDNYRLWDMATGEKMDKDRFRRDLGGFEEAYREVLRRMEAS
jgi:phosphoribosylaminoimidazole-succinocarboxamide synthase